MHRKPKIQITADWSGRLIFLLLTSPIWTLALFSLFRRPDTSYLLFALLVVVLPQMWLHSYKIALQEGRLTYRELFSRKTICLKRITKAKVEVGLGRDSRLKAKAMYRLMLYDDSLHERAPLVINMKPFSRSDLAIIANSILEGAPMAETDSAIHSLSQKNIQPLVRKAGEQFAKMAILIFITFLILGLLGAILRAMGSGV